MNKRPRPAKTADIVILGAGVMGASIAFHLAQRKPGSIVLSKDYVGDGASGPSSVALIRMHCSFAPGFHPALVSLRMFQQLREVVGERVTFASSASYGSFIRMKVNV